MSTVKLTMYSMRRSQNFNVSITAYKNMQTCLAIRAGIFFNTSQLYNKFLLATIFNTNDCSRAN